MMSDTEMKPSEILAHIANRVRELTADGDGFWRTCSGCHNTVDGYDVGKYPYVKAFQCKLGGGCSECGGLGAIWDNTDYSDFGDWAAHLAKEQEDSDVR